jgi:hypothetical protein
VRSLLRTLSLAAAALAAAVVLYLGLTLPPRAIALDGDHRATEITGAYHVHTSRSDGTGMVDGVAEAAARTGLAFVILTDHGDGTRQPDPPAYLHGVLVIDAVEINTTAGHLVALGLLEAAPYPLAGHPRDVIDDIHRLGGWAIVAHPDSPKPDLRWRGQMTVFDGIEWLNVDSEWRDERPGRILASAARSLLRAPETIAALFSRPARTLDRWDAAARRRPTFGIAAVDAHANIGWRENEEPRQRTAFAMPTYEAMFRTAAQTVLLDTPLSGDASRDAAALVAAIARGSSFSIVRAFADPASLDFTAEQDGHRVTMGGRLATAAPQTTFRASVRQAPGARVTLMADGRPIHSGQGSLQVAVPTRPGVYRVEVTLQRQPDAVPWLASNPIIVGPSEPPPPAPDLPITDAVTLPATPDRWTIEREPTTSASVAADGSALKFAFQLAPGRPRGQYAALVTDVRSESGIDRIRFTGRASRPMRLSLQLRLPDGGDGQRWRRSVYLDTTARPVSVPLQDFEPVETTTRRPIVAPVRTLLFVVDTLNSAPGSEGVIWISDVALGTRKP